MNIWIRGNVCFVRYSLTRSDNGTACIAISNWQTIFLPSPMEDLSSSVSPATIKGCGQQLALALNAKLKPLKFSSGGETGFCEIWTSENFLLYGSIGPGNCSPDRFLPEGACGLSTRLSCVISSPSHGRSFFDLCDGIFLNYNWNEERLRSSSTLAGGRKGEVYVGIDVFGRGCPGGGGYNSCEVGGSSVVILSGHCAENSIYSLLLQLLRLLLQWG